MTAETRFDKSSDKFPLRRELPKIDGALECAAWFWGAEDELGRLNLLIPERVKKAVAEVKTGEVITLNLPLNEVDTPCFAREKFQHTIKDLGYGLAGSQWDGLLHMSHISSGTFYNNTKPAIILTKTKLGIQALSEHGIVARGLLLDFASYAAHHKIAYRIIYTTLKAVGNFQNIDIRPASQGGDMQVGDVIFIRSNITLPPRPNNHVFGPGDGQKYVGVEQSEEVLDWLHDCYFAAVVGDMPSFEAWPSEKEYYLHEYLLALWGCPIGELWDLERLAERCRDVGKWSFLLTSSPANVKGGIGSPPNAIAIL
ncbi:hypothetical protein L873DRAFT_1834055 [Choiromyces venosus 120613-1]|uniref:Cyclase n=1 Tax=Choiromyces venosus 120613-1 TaxID=1336337 RepID=A0A3N4K2C2_9PEZI|nr:hypothetical protein L873DRAFT_1834055 [Choiromyces venosus 120613-1]